MSKAGSVLLWRVVPAGVGAIGVILALSLVRATPASAGTATQPIQFSHKIHAEKDLECTSCHEGAETQSSATLPPMDTCMGCHGRAKGKNPEEPKVREFADKPGWIPWVQVNQLPGHVYFSHRAHVVWGKLDCKECHGDMAKADLPVTVSQIGSLSMRRCEGCHREKHASNDCVTCHK